MPSDQLPALATNVSFRASKIVHTYIYTYVPMILTSYEKVDWIEKDYNTFTRTYIICFRFELSSTLTMDVVVMPFTNVSNTKMPTYTELCCYFVIVDDNVRTGWIDIEWRTNADRKGARCDPLVYWYSRIWIWSSDHPSSYTRILMFIRNSEYFP